LGFYAFHNVMQVHATQMAPAARGTSVSLYASCLFLGVAGGVWVAAKVVDHAGYRPMFFGCGLSLAVLGAVFCRSLRRR
jgi:predicted MFS family arabinose efflux permease